MATSEIQVAEHSLQHHFADMEQQKETSTFGMWMFLLTEIMFFGGLFCAYLVYRASYYQAFVEGSQKMNIWLGATNTAVLICSSLTHGARRSRRPDGQAQADVCCCWSPSCSALASWASRRSSITSTGCSMNFPDRTSTSRPAIPQHPATDPQHTRDLLLAVLGDDRTARAAHGHRHRPGYLDRDRGMHAERLLPGVLQSGGKRRTVLALCRPGVDLSIPAALSDQSSNTRRLTRTHGEPQRTSTM